MTVIRRNSLRTSSGLGKPLVLMVFGCFSLVSVVGACTKKSAQQAQAPTNAPNPPATGPQATPNQPNQPPMERIFRYALSSVAGDIVFCQDFSSKTQAPIADFESIADSMALAQAEIPAGVLNPFSPKTLGLNIKTDSCRLVPEIIKDGHCAISVSKNVSSGPLTLQTEQRLLWKDIPLLAQASYVKATIDNKNAAIKNKNDLFASVQKQISQQKQFLQILQVGQQLATGQQSELIRQTQELLTSLEAQSKTIEAEIKGLEDEIKPIQEELDKVIARVQTARESLRQACTTSRMGSMTAEWKDN